jgi:predicted enzyme related to lactoylglutathione lyase
MLRFAVVTDPQGAAFIMFTSNPAMPTNPSRPAPNTPGTVGWHELMAADGAAAFDFYSSQFGWAKGEVHDMGPMGLYRIFDVDGVPTGGMMTKPPNLPAPFWTYYFQVDGINAAVERIKAGGGTVLIGPHQVPGGSWIVQGKDPQGAMFALVSVTA